MFAAFILPISGTARSSKDIGTNIQRQLDLWYHGRYVALVDDTFTSSGGVGAGNQPRASPESQDERAARAFNHTYLSGGLIHAVIQPMVRKGGVVLTPDDVCTNIGRPVKDVLQEKHSRSSRLTLLTPTNLPLRYMRRSLKRYPSTSQLIMSSRWHHASMALAYQGVQTISSSGTGVPSSPLSQNISGGNNSTGPSG